MKDTIIVETFSKNLLNKEVDKQDLSMSNEYIRELASKASPESIHELGEILRFVINDGFTERVNYLDKVADVKRTGFNEKAQFEIEIDDLQGGIQAKSATTPRSKVSTRYFTIDTVEASVRPVVNFLDLVTGKTDLTRLAARATTRLEMTVVRYVQDVLYNAFKDLGNGVNYNTGAGITKGAFDPILHAMMRAGGGATILGDTEALSKFTELTGFGSVPDALAIEHNQNGIIGGYLGANLLQLSNPFRANSLTETELRKDLIYVIPSVEEELMPLKVQFEGDLQARTKDSIDSKQIEFRFDQLIGAEVAGARKLLGVYEDSTLSAE